MLTIYSLKSLIFSTTLRQVSLCQRCFSRTQQPSGSARVVHLVDPQWVTLLLDTLKTKSGFPEKNSTIFHINPVGPVLTEALLEAGAKCVVAWQKNVFKQPSFQVLQNKYDDRLKLYSRNFSLRESFSSYSDLQCDWDVENDKLMILGMFPLKSMANYIHILTMHLATTLSIHGLGRVPHYLFLHEREVELFSRETKLQNKASMHKIYYQLFFDIEVLQELPLTAFKGQLSGKGRIPDSKLIYLVKILPKQKLIFNGLDLFVFLKFLGFVKRNGNRRMVPLLESVCPDSGPEVIQLGYGMQDIISSVQTSNWAHIYKLISALPEFRQSAAYHSFIDNYAVDEKSTSMPVD